MHLTHSLFLEKESGDNLNRILIFGGDHVFRRTQCSDCMLFMGDNLSVATTFAYVYLNAVRFDTLLYHCSNRNCHASAGTAST